MLMGGNCASDGLQADGGVLGWHWVAEEEIWSQHMFKATLKGAKGRSGLQWQNALVLARLLLPRAEQPCGAVLVRLFYDIDRGFYR